MKKIKKLVACLSAAAIAMTVGVSAFAATATYEDGFVKVADAPIDAEHQWTVVVIAADKADATLTAEDLYYINQGTSGEAFWTNGMGTKTELADGEYIVRIGGETITDPGQLIEIPLKVESSTTGKTYTYGDVNNSGAIDLDDVMEVIYYYNFMSSVFDDGASWRITAGDVNKTGEVDLDDAMEIINYYNFMDSVFDDMGDLTFTE